jgi:hypothetical protein
MPRGVRSISCRFGLLVVVTSVVLLAPAASAGAAERCCLKATISERGFLLQDFDGGSDASIGTARSTWTWIERMILVYQDHASNPSFRLARLGGDVRPSSVYFGQTASTVQLKQPDGSYEPFARPGDCGDHSFKWRRGQLPVFDPRSLALPGPRARFPNAKYFLRANFQVAFDNGDTCLFGGGTVHVNDWEKQACEGSGGFSLPAPRRAWFRRGKGRIKKEVVCDGGHEEPSNERSESTTGLAEIVLEWFPRNRLPEYVKRLKKAHGAAKSPYEPSPTR